MYKNRVLILLIACITILYSCANNNASTEKSPSTIVKPDSTFVPEIPAAKLDSIVEKVLLVSATDFYKNQQPLPVEFKDVKLKYIKKPSGEELYILCGQFITNENQATDFATIKNSDYEQWIGNSASTYCDKSKMIPYTKKNLSLELTNKLNSLKR